MIHSASSFRVWVLAAVLAGFVVRAGLAVDPAVERLEKSPRHHEWVEVRSGEGTVHCYVVFPEVKHKGGAVVVIHENKGLTDWVRGAAEQVTEAGYIAIAPDLPPHRLMITRNGGLHRPFPPSRPQAFPSLTAA